MTNRRRGRATPLVATVRDRAGALPVTVWVAAAVLSVAAGCAHRKAAGLDDPTGRRLEFGNAATIVGGGQAAARLWWPVAPAEAAALNGIPAAQRGDARALLALAILASADVRDAAGIAAMERRVDQFVAAVRPTIAQAADEWHRGHELFRAMHRTFFTAGGDLKGYEANQPRLTGVFATGTYNCLSSTVLFVVLGRAFDLPVRAVAVPSHVFVEMGRPGTRPIEIETTSDLGFDLVHDRKFFAEQAAAWSAARGLPALTFEEYQRREILTPARLMALAMRNELPGASEDDQLRLAEVAAVVDADSIEMQQNRLSVYGMEAARLRSKQAWATLIRFTDVIGPAVSEIAARLRDPLVQQTVSWLTWYRGEALQNAGRATEALAIFDAGIDRIDPAWPDAAKLRNNFRGLLNDRLIQLLDAKAFPQGEQLVLAHLERCRADTACRENASVLYLRWAVDQYNVGDWPAARRTLRSCVDRLPAATRCRELLADVEKQHRL